MSTERQVPPPRRVGVHRPGMVHRRHAGASTTGPLGDDVPSPPKVSRVIVILALSAAGLLATSCSLTSSRAPDQQPIPQGTFARTLSTIAARASARAEGMPCKSRVFGYLPSSARTVAAVTHIYAWSLCGGVLIPPVRSGSFVPVSVSMGTLPVAHEPGDDMGPGDDGFDRLFPATVRAAASDQPSVAWLRAGS